MKTTSERIKEALELRGMKQSDLVEKTGIGKSSISTYISGAYEPKQRNIYKIARALDVNEAWLMGYDVPMERLSMPQSDDSPVLKAIYDSGFTDSELSKEIIMRKLTNKMKFEPIDITLLPEFKKLNSIGKSEAINRVTELTFVPQYTEINSTQIKKKEKYIPTEEDIRSLVARNGKKMTREEAIDFISAMYSDDDEDNED